MEKEAAAAAVGVVRKRESRARCGRSTRAEIAAIISRNNSGTVVGTVAIPLLLMPHLMIGMGDRFWHPTWPVVAPHTSLL